MASGPASIDDYIDALDEGLKPVAQTMRKTIREAAPQAGEAIKYGMPTYRIGKHSILYFAVWKKHVGLYPIYRGTAAFEEAIAPFRAKKDTVQFALNKPIPLDIVRQIVASQLSRTPAS